MNYEETLNYIHSLGKFRLPSTLDRMKQVCEILGNPQDSFKSIHIAGTNGKGSIATMTAEILKKSGLNVGLFTSPFIVCFRERIQINNEYISEEDLIKYSKIVVDTKIELNEFEFITAVAFLYFKEKNVDICVLETGLGGRLDATNVIKKPIVSVITKIGLDHTAILGDTIEKITAEKCGIIKDGAKVVTVPNQEKGALSVIKEFSKDLIIPEAPKIISSDLSGNTFLCNGEEYFVSLLGEHQAINAVTAIETVKNSGFDVSKSDIDNALKTVKFPARLEIVSENPITIIDGAHNPDGAKVLAHFLKKTETATMIIAMMRDKNCDGFLRETLPYVQKCIVTEIDNPRCMSADELYEISMLYNKNAVKIDNLKDAVICAKTSKSPIFFAGSLYLASEARKFYI